MNTKGWRDGQGGVWSILSPGISSSLLLNSSTATLGELGTIKGIESLLTIFLVALSKSDHKAQMDSREAVIPCFW